jgi:phosphate acyltransferase
MVKLAIDCMGGDHGIKVTVPAALNFASSHPDASVLLVGREEQIKAAIPSRSAALGDRLSIVHATEVVEMDDPVEVALRKKRDSSIRVATSLVKEGRADACISAGNTGALMAVSRYVLKTLPGIDRPAIATELPNIKGDGTLVLDLGANPECEPQHLLQFAVMGVALAQAIEGRETPRVGLLNIGEEIIKGNETVKAAGELLRASPLNFIGNIEGNDIFKGTADVVVCDGFVGNVALKSSEGVALMIRTIINEEFGRGLFSLLLKYVAAPVLLRVKDRVDHRRYNGAALVGLNGIVIKSHGSMDAFGFEFAIRRGYDAVKNRVLERIGTTMGSMQHALVPAAAIPAPVQAKDHHAHNNMSAAA